MSQIIDLVSNMDNNLEVNRIKIRQNSNLIKYKQDENVTADHSIVEAAIEDID